MEAIYTIEYAESQSRKFPRSHVRIMDTQMPINPQDEILEIGSGNGSFLSILRERSNHVIGMDINQSGLGIQNTIRADARALPFDDNSFDKVISSHTLEHIEDLATVFKEIDRVTRPGGKGLHFFPAHFITKAEGAIFDAIRMFGFNRRAWEEAHKMHVHWLNPHKLYEFMGDTELRITGATKFVVPETHGTNWAILLEKKNTASTSMYVAAPGY